MCACVCVCVCVCVSMCMGVHYILFIHSSVNGHVGSFHSVATVDIAAINIGEGAPSDHYICIIEVNTQ